MQFIQRLQKSLGDINSGLGKGLLIVVLDAVFIMASSFVFSSLFRSIWEPLLKLLAFFFNRTEPDPELAQYITDIASTQDVMALIHTIIIKATIFFFVLMVVWTLFQTVIWHIAYTIAKRPEKHLPLRVYGLRMLIVNLIFFPILYAVIRGTIQLSYGTRIQSALIAGGFTFLLSQQIIFWGGIIVTLLVFIAMHLCYPVIMEHSIKKTAKRYFAILKQKFWKLSAVFLFIIIALFVSQKIQTLLMQFNLTITFLVGFFMDFGLLLLLRIWTINTVFETKKEKVEA